MVALQIGGAAAGLLNEAADIYQEIHVNLQAFADLLPFEGKHDDHYKQSERFAQLAIYIKQAKSAEQLALIQLKK
jgi:hypothetical protein